jgi:hypothetical protein
MQPQNEGPWSPPQAFTAGIKFGDWFLYTIGGLIGLLLFGGGFVLGQRFHNFNLKSLQLPGLSKLPAAIRLPRFSRSRPAAGAEESDQLPPDFEN